MTIKMVNIAFSPASTSVKVGQTVKWTNQDSVEHNVVATAGATFKSPNFGAGGSYSHKFTKAGKVSYVCTIHPNMKATLTVTK
ncbi:MAG TPA: plastocyanin/azurin family copper-binding protein [Solirubrobacteraceae bacterium]|nr:plastocyanin/azurin family copper-binding protein [Solirubrobacteraceae bacterium]